MRPGGCKLMAEWRKVGSAGNIQQALRIEAQLQKDVAGKEIAKFE